MPNDPLVLVQSLSNTNTENNDNSYQTRHENQPPARQFNRSDGYELLNRMRQADDQYIYRGVTGGDRLT